MSDQSAWFKKVIFIYLNKSVYLAGQKQEDFVIMNLVGLVIHFVDLLNLNEKGCALA